MAYDIPEKPRTAKHWALDLGAPPLGSATRMPALLLILDSLRDVGVMEVCHGCLG